MAERLTNTLEETPTLGFGLKFCSDRNCNSDEDCCNCYAFNQTINKLRQLEDIMEKYGIESVEELDDLIANYRTSPILTEEMIKEIAVNEQRKVIQSMIKEITEKECNQLYTELNTWKKACELACEREDDCYVYDNIHRAYEFYQQAKKEGEHGN